MVSQLADIPNLPGARCRGRTELYDTAAGGRPHHPADVDYARGAALRLCHQCPALDRCTEWLESLPAQQQPRGVVAGRLNTPGEQVTQPIDLDNGPSDPSKVRVPARFGDGTFTDDEYIEVDPEIAGQWDARQWHDEPPL